MQTTHLENEIDVRENINNNIPDLRADSVHLVHDRKWLQVDRRV